MAAQTARITSKNVPMVLLLLGDLLAAEPDKGKVTMSQSKPTRQFATLTDAVRHITGGLTTRIGNQLWAIGVHPDLLTFLGSVMVAIAGLVASQGAFVWAAAIIVLGAPLDALDGAVARAMQRTDKFGALWDSTLDRYSDAFIFMGLTFYFSRKDDETGMLLAMITMLGALLVSYVRARAGGLKVDCEVGLLTRMERVFIILIMLISGWIKPGLWILAFGTHITVAQRVWHVRQVLNERGNHTP